MKLREILELKAGTLIKGLSVSPEGKIGLQVNGWKIEKESINEKRKSYVKALDADCYELTSYKDKRVKDLVKSGKIHIYNSDQVMYSALKHNGESYYKDIRHHFEKEELEIGECIGMSLGKNFIAIQPFEADVYRPDFYEIYVFHNILRGEKSQWIVLQSKTQYKRLLMINPDQVLLDIDMELL